MKIGTKITIFFLVISFIILLCFGILFYLGVRHVIYETIRDNLVTIFNLTEKYLQEHDETALEVHGGNYFSNNLIMIYRQGRVVYASEESREKKLKLDTAFHDGSFYTLRKDKDIYRVYVRQVNINNSSSFICIALSINEREHELKIISLSLITGFLFFFMILAVSGFIFSRYILKPFNRIIKTINEISEKNLSRRLHGHAHNDEIGQLSGSVNRLFDRLENAFKLQKNFIANISHELKTPIAILRLTNESLLNDDNLPQVYYDRINTSHEVIYSMNLLIKKLLLLAELDELQNPLQFARTDLDQLIRKVYDTLHILAQEKNLDFILEFHGENFYITADAGLLYIAIFNVVENAIKYTEKGSITIKCENSDRAILFGINDTGPGIPEEDRGKIFNRFYRSGEINKKVKGYGIGLSIAKRIFDLHGAVIGVESSPGKGTKFILNFKK